MDFLKKNYEKLLLGIVLLGLALAVGFLPFVIANQKQALEDLKNNVRPANVKPLTNLNLTVIDTALKRAATPAMIDFGPPNRLFNPMPWKKMDDNQLLPMDKIGPTALVVTNVRELYLTITLDSVNTDASGTPVYIIGVDKPAATGAGKTHSQHSCTATSKNKIFSVVGVKGTPDDPQLVLELEDTKEKVVISKSKPFQRVEGYVADLRYDPERKRWSDCRMNVRLSPPLAFNGEEYNIVALNKDEVVLSAKSNGKKWTVKANSGP